LLAVLPTLELFMAFLGSHWAEFAHFARLKMKKVGDTDFLPFPIIAFQFFIKRS